MKTNTIIRLLFFLQSEALKKQFNDDLISDNDEFTSCMTTDLSNCLITASNDTYDVLITDFCDSDLDFNDTVTQIKEASNSLAIMLLTKQSGHLNEIEFLNSGAESWSI